MDKKQIRHLLFFGGLLIGLLGAISSNGYIITFSIISVISSFFVASSIHTDVKKFASENISKQIKDSCVNTDQQVIADDYLSAITIDESNKKVVLFSRDKQDQEFAKRIVEFKDIIEVKVNKNSQTVTQTSRGSQIGGAVVGGVLAGGVGAVVGGLSGSTTSSEKVVRLSLEIVLNDIKNPVFEIYFYNSGIALSSDSDVLQRLEKKINHWFRVFTVVIKQNNEISLS